MQSGPNSRRQACDRRRCAAARASCAPAVRAQRREGHLSVSGAADPAGLRADPARQGQGLFQGSRARRRLRGGRGGVDVAKQVGAGNAPLGGIVADGPIMVRGNGVPVKIVAVFGGKGFMQTVVREDSGIDKPADLKGKTITVMSFQDTTFYALLGLLASVGLTQNDVNIQAAGPTGVWESVADRQVGRHGRRAGLDPADAGRRREGEGSSRPTSSSRTWRRAIAASDQMIKEKPEMIRKFVKAALRGMKDIMDDPDKAADEFVNVRAGVEGQGRRRQGRVQLLRQARLCRQKSSARSMPSGFASCRTSIWRRASSRRRRRSRSSTPTSSSNRPL